MAINAAKYKGDQFTRFIYGAGRNKNIIAPAAIDDQQAYASSCQEHFFLLYLKLGVHLRVERDRNLESWLTLSEHVLKDCECVSIYF